MLRLQSLSKYEGDFDSIIEDYCRIFNEVYSYNSEGMVRNVFYDIYENKKDGYVLLDEDDLQGVIIFHADHDIGVIHFFHIKQSCAQYKAFKVMLEHALQKIKVNVSKIVFLSELFNFGIKQRRTIMAQFDFDEKMRDLYEISMDDFSPVQIEAPEIELRAFDYEHIENIGNLAYYSFAGSMELEVFPVGFEKENFVQEMQNAFNGIYGRFLHDYSMEVYDEERALIGAIIAVDVGESIALHAFFLGPKSWGKNYGYMMLVKYMNLLHAKERFKKIITLVSHENLKVKYLLNHLGFELKIELPVYSRILK